MKMTHEWDSSGSWWPSCYWSAERRPGSVSGSASAGFGRSGSGRGRVRGSEPVPLISEWRSWACGPAPQRLPAPASWLPQILCRQPDEKNEVCNSSQRNLFSFFKMLWTGHFFWVVKTFEKIELQRVRMWALPAALGVLLDSVQGLEVLGSDPLTYSLFQDNLPFPGFWTQTPVVWTGYGIRWASTRMSY